jgi:hypothetical protein
MGLVGVVGIVFWILEIYPGENFLLEYLRKPRVLKV